MTDIIDFYSKVAQAIGCVVSDDGFIQQPHKGRNITVTNDDKSLVMPTKDHIDTMVDIDEDGKPVVTKTLFNILNEDAIKKDGAALSKAVTNIEAKLSFSIYTVGVLLMTLAKDVNYQKKTSMELNKFLISLNAAENTAIKDIVDDKSIETWTKLYTKSLEQEPSNRFLKLYLKKMGTYSGVKYNRLAVANLYVYEELSNMKSNDKIYDIKLSRNKDIKVFKLLFEYMLEDIDSNFTINVGSNDKTAPAFISLFTMYHNIASRLNKIAKQLKFISESLYDAAHIPHLMSVDMITDIDKYKSQLAMIPSDADVNREKSRIIAGTNQQQFQQPQQPSYNQHQHHPMQQQVQQPQHIDVIDRILNSGEVQVLPTVDVFHPNHHTPQTAAVGMYYPPQDPYNPYGYQQQPMQQNPYLQQQLYNAYQQPVQQNPYYTAPVNQFTGQYY